MSSAEMFQMLAMGAIAAPGDTQEFKYRLLELAPDHYLHSECKNCGNQGLMYIATMCLGQVLDINEFRIYFCPKCNHVTVFVYEKDYAPAIAALPHYWRRFVEIERPD